MIPVSENLKTLISEDSRTFRVRLLNDLNTYKNIRTLKKSTMFPSSSLSIGNALSSCIECNATDIPISITGQKLKAEITILGCDEQILLGTFKAEKPTVKDGDVSFVAYDAMKSAAEKTYKSTLDEGEHTAQEYFYDICTVLGEECKPLTEADSVLVIAEDKLSGYSCRDALGFLAGYLGKNCLVNRDGFFEMVSFTAADYDLINEKRISEPEFADSFCSLGYINCCIDNETTLQSGAGSNGFEFISTIMTQERLDAVGESVFGENSQIKDYRPCRVVQLLGDPRIEICDVLDLSYGGEIYKLPVMSVILEYDGGLMATVESYAPSEPQSTSLGERMTFTQKQAQKENNAHINGIVEFSQLIQAAYGVKSTNFDGITYFHDMETLAESSFIFCITSEGFAQASGVNCWGGSHKDTVWKYGLSKDGSAVLNMLNVFKITASLIKAGRLESNDGSAYFDLDEGVIGVKKTDKAGTSLYDALFSYYGLDIDIKNINAGDNVELTEEEEMLIKEELLNRGYTEGTLEYRLWYAIIASSYKMLKSSYGVNITGKDIYGAKFKSHHGANKFFINRETYDGDGNKTGSTTTQFTADGIESDGRQNIKAPEIYFEGDVYINGQKIQEEFSAIYTASKDVQITEEGIDVSTEGATLVVPPGTYIVTGFAAIQTGTKTGTRNNQVRLTANKNQIAGQRTYAAAYNYASMTVSAIFEAQYETTFAIHKSSTIAENQVGATKITALRIGLGGDSSSSGNGVALEEIEELLKGKADLVKGKVPTEQLPAIPSKVSDLVNDSGFLTEDDVVEMLPENAVEEVYIGDNPPDTAKVWINPEEEPTEFPSMKDVEDAIVEAIAELTDGEAVSY